MTMLAYSAARRGENGVILMPAWCRKHKQIDKM